MADSLQQPATGSVIVDGTAYSGAMKSCSRCKKILPRTKSYFYTRGTKRPGSLTPHCKECSKLAGAKYRASNLEKIKSKSLIYRQKNSQYLAKYKKEYYQSKDRDYWLKKERDYHSRFPNKKLNNDLKKNYGISLQEYLDLLAKQNFTCAICKKTPTEKNKKRLSVDHDRLTGKIRGLLCQKCNAGIGMFLNDKALLVSAIEYLEEGF